MIHLYILKMLSCPRLAYMYTSQSQRLTEVLLSLWTEKKHFPLRRDRQQRLPTTQGLSLAHRITI